MADQPTENTELVPDYLTSPTSGASPAQSPYNNRAFWGSYKSLSRGLWGGIMVGSVMGTIVGGLTSLAVMAGTAAAGAAISGVAALSITGAFAFAGMLYYAEKFSIAGATSGAVSTVMEIYEERKAEEALSKGETLSPTQKELLDRKNDHKNGELKNDYTPENNPADDRFRPYYWNVGLAGAALGAVVGALVYAFGGGLDGLLGGHATEGADTGFTGMIQNALAGIKDGTKLLMLSAGGAAAGSTFGINRYYLRQPFYLANALFEGDIKQFSKQREHERQLTREYRRDGRIEPNLEELAPSAYIKNGTAKLSNGYDGANQEAAGQPSNVVKEASWGFDLQTKPGKNGEQDATVTYSATASDKGAKLFEQKFHGSWKDFQEKMKHELETMTGQGRQS